MRKAIISLKLNRINSLPRVDSISSLSLIINRIGNGTSSVDFKKIIVLHEDYLVSRDRIGEMKSHISEISSDSNEIVKVYSENLKNYLSSQLEEDLEEIFIVSGFTDPLDQIYSTEILYDLFSPYKINFFNTLYSSENLSDFNFCQKNIERFLNYISQK